MKVFLSWSGDVSHQIALKLHGWLPMVIQRVEPYISSEIDKGSRWGTDIAAELEQCAFGIACVTKENLSAPWLLFEAGALSKSVTDGKLAPLLCGINQTDVQKSPLTQFQMTKFEKSEFLKLLKSINDCEGENSLDETVLTGIFNALWGDLETDVSKILSTAVSTPTSGKKETDPDRITRTLEELLSNSRSLGQIMASPERLLPPDYLNHVLNGADRSRYGRPRDLQRVYHRVRQSVGLLEDVIHRDGEVDREGLKRAYGMLMDARFMLRDLSQGARPGMPHYYREVPMERPDALALSPDPIAEQEREG